MILSGVPNGQQENAMKTITIASSTWQQVAAGPEFGARRAPA
jgi:hypothetical protein